MSDLFRIPSVKEEPENKYSFLGFKQNPFPVNPAVKPFSDDERENGSIYLTRLRADEIRQFKDIVINRPNKISLLMDYAAFRGRGIGKTAFLNYKKNQINVDLGSSISNNEKVLYSLYICPGGEKKERKFWQLARLIYEAALNENLILIAFCRMRVILGKLDEKILREVTIANLNTTIGNDKWLYDRGVDVQELDILMNRKFKENGLDISIDNKNLYGNSFELFRDSLCNDFSDLFWRRSGIDLVFNTLVKILKEAAFSNCIILFDEAEKIIVSQNFNERREFCESLRFYFIDGSNVNSTYSFFKILITIHPYSQELLQTHWGAAGLERFSQLGTDEARDNTIFFQPLNNDSEIAKDLATIYLDKARINGESSDITPFTVDALHVALNRSEGIPGKYLKILYNAFEKAVNENWEKITAKEIESVWKSVSKIELSKDISEPLPETKFRLD